jgi:hypothetical protein
MSTETSVKERPVLFSGSMVNAITDDHKSQTRRVVKIPKWADQSEPIEVNAAGMPECICRATGCLSEIACPYGVPGDRLWVRETWQAPEYRDWKISEIPFDNEPHIVYRADYLDDVHGPDGEKSPEGKYRTWRPAIHMPRRASRLTLEITDVRVERLQEISGDDAFAEGIQLPISEGGYLVRVSGKFPPCDYHRRIDLTKGETLSKDELAIAHYASLWDAINGAESWAENPVVWVVSFKKVEVAT